MYIPDNYDQFLKHEREQEQALARLPRCAKCGEPIISEKAYEVDGWYCQTCFDEWVNDISEDTDELIEGDEW